jgi:hypothetical protein
MQLLAGLMKAKKEIQIQESDSGQEWIRKRPRKFARPGYVRRFYPNRRNYNTALNNLNLRLLVELSPLISDIPIISAYRLLSRERGW